MPFPLQICFVGLLFLLRRPACACDMPRLSTLCIQGPIPGNRSFIPIPLLRFLCFLLFFFLSYWLLFCFPANKTHTQKEEKATDLPYQRVLQPMYCIPRVLVRLFRTKRIELPSSRLSPPLPDTNPSISVPSSTFSPSLHLTVNWRKSVNV